MKRLNKKYFLLMASKLKGNIPDPCNAKEHYKSFMIKENRKSVKQAEIITYQPRTFQNPELVDIKSQLLQNIQKLHSSLIILLVFQSI